MNAPPTCYGGPLHLKSSPESLLSAKFIWRTAKFDRKPVGMDTMDVLSIVTEDHEYRLHHFRDGNSFFLYADTFQLLPEITFAA